MALFWRSLQKDPDAVAHYADWPVNEADLRARHSWLVNTARKRAERVKKDPDFYDAKIAGWWVWGQCLWIGSGWCQRPEWTGRANAGGHARGEDPSKQHKRPKLRSRGTDGVAFEQENSRRWQGGGQAGGSGVHAPTLQKPMNGSLWNQIPQLSGDGSGAQRGLLSDGVRETGLYVYLRTLSERLRRVRVCCGDWKRVLTPSVTTYIGVTGVFLDPPYDHDMRERCYSEDHNISGDVREWALENGDDPKMRIALCGYEGEHVMPASWVCVPWKAHGGYSRTDRGKANRAKERIWFSPHCLRPCQSDLNL